MDTTKYLEPSPHQEDNAELVGKPPQKIPLEDLVGLGHPDSPLKAIRAKCLDCVYSLSEVRKCVQYSCPLWPMRMGKNPFHKRSSHNREASK